MRFSLLLPRSYYQTATEALLKERSQNGVSLSQPIYYTSRGDGFIPLKELHSALGATTSDWSLFVISPNILNINWKALSAVIDTHASAFIIYFDYILKENLNKETYIPLETFQEGSVRDDFDMGPIICIKTNEALRLLESHPLGEKITYGAIYALILSTLKFSLPIHIKEPITTVKKNGKDNNIFSYQFSENSQIQKEMEEIFTLYAKEAGFYLEPITKEIKYDQGNFNFEASVVIPVKNREKTIHDAVLSAASQKTSFTYNILVVENHSTDSTPNILKKAQREIPNLKVVIPKEKDLLIGGCWNKAVYDSDCGKFAIQLDSDDLYSDENALQKIVDKFYESGAGAVVGSYRLVDFNMKEIPPGVIAHREWSDSNGHNNALRLNGFGAPRAFYTPIIRQIGFPNVSYGEDYAAMLALSRQYKIARIYDPIYLCRRWEDNTDSCISPEQQKIHNEYKDTVRTNEIRIRKEINLKNEN